MTASWLRDGWRFRVDPSVERFGSVVMGGSPLRVLHLSESGTRLLDEVWQPSVIDLGPVGNNPSEATSPPTHDSRLDALIDRLVGNGMLHPIPPPRPATGNVTIVTPAYGIYGDERTLADSVVVDDGSDPPIATAALRLDTNRGPAAARNAGLEMVATEFVAFVDADVTVEAGWLDGLLAHFDDPTVALVAPRVRATPSGDSRLGRYETDHSPLDLGTEPALIAPGSRVGYVPGTAIVCRTETIRQIGGFDQSLRYGEDVDLVWRLVANGFRCRYEPTTVVSHPPRPTWRAWWRQRANYGTSAAPLALRHGEAVAPARLNRWSALAWLLATGGPVSQVAAIGTALASAAALPRQIPLLPPKRAAGLALNGTWLAGAQLAQAVRRGWWPVLVVAALLSTRARRALIASALAAMSPIRFVDDLAYSTGVWKGCLRERSLAALAPKIT